MSRCRTRRSTSPMETSPSTSEPRSLPATTSRPRSLPRSVATSTSRRAERRASTRSSSASGPARVGRSASSASSSASGSTHDVQPRRDLPGLPWPDGQVRPPRRTQRRLHDGRRRGQAGRLARLPRHRQHQLRVSTPGESTLEVIESLDELRERIPPQLFDMVAGSAQRAAGRGPRHLILGRSARVRREVRHDRHRRPGRRSAPPGCASRTASRSSSTASTSTSPKAPCSRCSARTAPARRRRSTSCRR